MLDKQNMELESFLELVKSANPVDLAAEFLHRGSVHAIPDESLYGSFLDEVRVDYPSSERIAIMGSGNWKFSLNPKKNFSEFHDKSDIDIVIICRASFEQAWEELRKYHRQNFYRLTKEGKAQLKRTGENVYSGFLSPKWIPGKSTVHFIYEINSNKYSNKIIGYRNVNMMYYKNLDEALDYYVRGFRIAQFKELSHEL